MPIDILSLPKSTLLDTEAAATVLDVTPGTLTVWRSTGRYQLPYVKVGRKVRYRVTDLLAFMDRRTFQHTGEALRG